MWKMPVSNVWGVEEEVSEGGSTWCPPAHLHMYYFSFLKEKKKTMRKKVQMRLLTPGKALLEVVEQSDPW